MRLTRVIPFVPLASALVITDAGVFENIEKSHSSVIGNVEKSGRQFLDNAQSVLDDAFTRVKDSTKDVYNKIHDTGYHVESWLESSSLFDDSIEFDEAQIDVL
jgi:hypothetical protein